MPNQHKNRIGRCPLGQCDPPCEYCREQSWAVEPRFFEHYADEMFKLVENPCQGSHVNFVKEGDGSAFQAAPSSQLTDACPVCSTNAPVGLPNALSAAEPESVTGTPPSQKEASGSQRDGTDD